MITQKKKNIGGLLLAVKHRKAGSMERENKVIEWADRYQIVLLSFEGENERAIRKYSISPSYEKNILKGLDLVHWGALLEIELDSSEIVSLTVVSDILKDFYESEIEL